MVSITSSDECPRTAVHREWFEVRELGAGRENLSSTLSASVCASREDAARPGLLIGFWALYIVCLTFDSHSFNQVTPVVFRPHQPRTHKPQCHQRAIQQVPCLAATICTIATMLELEAGEDG